jgi:uncharacterized protein (TIGR02246 family)
MDRQKDRMALVELFRSVDRAWDHRDAKALSALYSSDATLTLFGGPGQKAQGREQIERVFAASFVGLPPGAVHRSTQEAIVFLDNDTALTDSHVRLKASDTAAQPLVYMTVHIVTHREPNGEWRIGAIRGHVKPVADAPRAPGG